MGDDEEIVVPDSAATAARARSGRTAGSVAARPRGVAGAVGVGGKLPGASRVSPTPGCAGVVQRAWAGTGSRRMRLLRNSALFGDAAAGRRFLGLRHARTKGDHARGVPFKSGDELRHFTRHSAASISPMTMAASPRTRPDYPRTNDRLRVGPTRGTAQ
jgi:hypothetical protein